MISRSSLNCFPELNSVDLCSISQGQFDFLLHVSTIKRYGDFAAWFGGAYQAIEFAGGANGDAVEFSDQVACADSGQICGTVFTDTLNFHTPLLRARNTAT